MSFNPCLLIPVYNHGALIEATLDRLRGLELPCLIVDDGSEEATAGLLRSLAESESWLTLLRQEPNQGKGVAVLRGVAEARRLGYSHAVQLDADGQHTLEDIPAMLDMARENPQALVSAAPLFDDSIPPARLYGRYVTHFWVWVETLSFSIVDSMCGFRVYPVAATDDLATSHPVGRRMDFDTDVLVRLYWRGVPVLFLPSPVRYPADGISHFAPLADNLRISWMHTRLFFGMLVRSPVLLARKFRGPDGAESDGHWSSVRESGAYTGLLLSATLYRVLGRRVMGLILYPIMGYFFLRNRPAREASLDFLNRVYRFQQSDVSAEPFFESPPGWRASFHHFMQFGRAIVDRLGAWTGEMRREEALFHGREHLERCAASGRGGVIFSSHLGNAELFRGLVKQVGDLKMNVLVFNENARHMNRLMKRLNPGADLELIPISTVDPGTAMRLNEKVGKGEFIVIAADRTSAAASAKSMYAPFLGEPAAFPQGTFILAGLLDCPVFLMFGLDRGRYHLYVEQFADRLPIPRRRRQALLQQYIERYALRLQHYALMAPDQWFNFYDFWTPIAQEPDVQPGQDGPPDAAPEAVAGVRE